VKTTSKLTAAIIGLTTVALVGGCASNSGLGQLPAAQFVSPAEGPGPEYIVGPLDQLNIFVWRNPELSTQATVRPDGRVTLPLIEDIAATGQTPAQLARQIEDKLKSFIQNPIVSVVVGGFNGPFASQVRVVGEASEPRAIPYRSNMTLLDVMIAVGGLTEFAAGDSARLIRFDRASGTQKEYAIKISRLIKDGDTRANVRIEPGDVIIIPESFF
jgi:polysaccharide biosynthesis/export protein